jgi:hypothetical protein
MNPNSIVIVSLHSPKEKVWGMLLDINPSGVTIRGVDLNSFDHFVRQLNEPDGERVGLPTVFFPMTRVERISLYSVDGRHFSAQIGALVDRISRSVRLNYVIL